MHLSLFVFFCSILNENVLTNDEIEDKTGGVQFDMPLFSECFEDIGCIEVTEEWYHPKYRPVNLKPLKRHAIKTEFLIVGVDDNDTLLFEKASAYPRSIDTAGFQKGSDVIIAIHDFTSDGYTGWIKHLSSAVLTKYPVNLISVDWAAGAEPPFDQAVANARLVALEIIVFINVLLTMGTTKDDIHLIGHGVGAHIAGYVGGKITGLKKISGLDPTGPRFQFMPELVRLHSGCAKYVEVLHTDYFQAVSQGAGELMGDADFFINNSNLQPGCKEVKHHSLLEIGRQEVLPGQIMPGCSHKRSFKYFIESIENKDCIFVGVRCDSFKMFSEGECTSCMPDTEYDTCITFGLQSKHNISPNFSYYLNTAAESPFCLYTYAVTFKLDSTEHSFTGFFDIILRDENDKFVNLSNPDKQYKYRTFKSNFENRYLYYAPHPRLGKLKQANVKWTKKHSIIGKFIFKRSGIPIKKITIEPVTRGPVFTTLFQQVENKDSTEVPSGQYRMFEAYEVIPKIYSEKLKTTTSKSLTSTTKKSKTITTSRFKTKKPKEKMKKKKT